MLEARDLLDILKNEGVASFSGVPCSLLGAVFSELERDSTYVSASIEGEALAVAAGAWLAGKEAAVFCQNSGLGNLVNGLTSLNMPFSIPAMLFIGWRGEPGMTDEPQHEMMGDISPQLLALMAIPWWRLSDQAEEAGAQVRAAAKLMRETGRPVAFLVGKNTFSPAVAGPAGKGGQARQSKASSVEPAASDAELHRRMEALEAILGIMPEEAALIATTGKAGRELFTLKDRAQHLYMVGAMGSASAVGLGVALNGRKPVVVIDGDGAALMRLGTMAVIGDRAPENLIHIVLDNGCHESTGGQRGAAPALDFPGVAAASGYRTVHSGQSLAWLRETVALCLAVPGPHCICMQIVPGSPDKLARPDIAPHVVARRFRDFLIS